MPLISTRRNSNWSTCWIVHASPAAAGSREACRSHCVLRSVVETPMWISKRVCTRSEFPLEVGERAAHLVCQPLGGHVGQGRVRARVGADFHAGLCQAPGLVPSDERPASRAPFGVPAIRPTHRSS